MIYYCGSTSCEKGFGVDCYPMPHCMADCAECAKHPTWRGRCLCYKARKRLEECSHEWHADQDNDCNFCVKCGARQEIYYDAPYDDVPIDGDTPK